MVHLYTLLPFLGLISAMTFSGRDESRENEKVGDDFVRLKLPNCKQGNNYCISKAKDPDPSQLSLALGEDCDAAPEVRMQIDGTIGKIQIKYGEEEKTVLEVFPKNDKGVWNTGWSKDDDTKSSQNWSYDGSRIRFRGEEIDGRPVDEELCLGLHYYDDTQNNYFVQSDPCTEGIDPEPNFDGAILQEWSILEPPKAEEMPPAPAHMSSAAESSIVTGN